MLKSVLILVGPACFSKKESSYVSLALRPPWHFVADLRLYMVDKLQTITFASWEAEDYL
jgi:hypothetical protein